MIRTKDTQTLVDVAYQNIRKDITEEFLQSGQKINIGQLSERYSISQTPIKQALNRLMMEGIVENIPRKGMKVKRVSWSEIDEILDIRIMLETYFVDQVIISLDSNRSLRDRFEENLQTHYNFVERFSDVSEYFRVYQLDQQFHELYLTSSGNKKAVQVYNSLNSHAYATYLYQKQPREKTLAGVEEHRMLYEALCAKDRSRALELIDLHYRNAKDIIYLMLKIGNNL